MPRWSGARGRLRWADLPLRKKGVVVVAIPLLAMLVAVGAFSLSAERLRRVERRAAQSTRERFVAHNLLLAMFDAESGVRGYLLTGREQFLDPYADAVASATFNLTRLKQLLGRDAAYDDSLRRLDDLAEERLALLLELRSVPSEPRRLALLNRGLVVREQLREEIDSIVAVENAQLARARTAAEDAQTLSMVIIASSLLLGLLGGVVAMMAFSSGVVRRIRRLDQNAALLAEGKSPEALSAGEDEVGRLGRAMERAADRLARTQGLLRGVIEGTPDGIFVKDLDGRYLLINAAAAEFVHKAPKDVLGKTDADLFPPDEAAAFREADRQVVRSARVETFEGVARREREVRAYLVTKGPIRDASGRITGVFGISRDVTDRHRMEQEIRERERRFRTLSELAPAGIFLTDAQGKCTFVNRRWSEITGLSEYEALGDGWTTSVHPGDRERVSGAWRSNPDGFNEQYRYLLPDGSARWALGNAVALRDEDGSLLGYLGIVIDVTDRWHAERERDRFFDLAADLFCVAGFDGYFHRLNAAWSRTLGWSGEELVSRPFLEFVHPEDREATARVTDRIGEGATASSFENRYRTKDGTYRWLVWNAIPFPEERVIYAIARDVTDQKHAAQELDRFHHELEATHRALGKRARELERSNKELEHFAYVASHDLQEPLRIVAGYAQLLGKRYRGRLDRDAEEFIGYMVDGVRRMHELINGLLQYSRVGTKGEEMTRIDLDVPVDDAMANLEVTIEGAKARITRDDLPEVVADHRQLTQLFQNLLSNAIKFHGDLAPAVHVGAERRNGEVVVEIRDNGIGIDPDYRDRIFEIFERLHGRGRYEGTGIGLAICRKIVERHGGRIWVDSEAGRGAVFRFTIPTTPQDP